MAQNGVWSQFAFEQDGRRGVKDASFELTLMAHGGDVWCHYGFALQRTMSIAYVSRQVELLFGTKLKSVSVTPTVAIGFAIVFV